MSPRVVSVSASPTHSFSKFRQDHIDLLTGLGVKGDAHCGEKVKHRSRVAVDPSQPNLRQVHLIHSELFDELTNKGFSVGPAEFGENITTVGVSLLTLPVGTRLHIGSDAVVELTGLRNPCSQIDAFQSGLLRAVLDRSSTGKLIRKAGVMGIVISGGAVCPGDEIRVLLPPEPHRELDRV
jgi:MOSC domain-containing protein YiiM